MTVKDIVKAVSKRNKLKQLDVLVTIQDAEKIIMGALAKGSSVELKGFGSFYAVTRKDNEDKVGIKFQPSRAFKDIVNGIVTNKNPEYSEYPDMDDEAQDN